MGVKGLWTFFHDLFDKINPLQIPTKLHIGIDIYSLAYTYRQNLKELLTLLESWSKHGHTITCVWDGTAPAEKKEILETRRNIRDTAINKKAELELYLKDYGSELKESDIKTIHAAIKALSWQGWHMTGTLKKEIRDALGPAVNHICAIGEADDVLIQIPDCDVIISQDSDMFAMGNERIWRLLYIRKHWVIEEIRIENICNNWGLSLENLQDACFLAGWDRCHMSQPGYMTFDSAIRRVKYYGSWQKVISKTNILVNPAAVQRLEDIKCDSKARWRGILERRKRLTK